MKIGNTELAGKVILAPMAGVADRAFRELCVGYGAAWCVSEMVSGKGITMHDRKSAALMQISEKERPMAIQLFGDDPLIVAASVEKALESNPEAIDINMGCPAPKISGNGGGSALMKNPELCGRMVAEVKRAAGDVPVTVKIRKGWDENCLTAVEVAKRVEAAGAAAIAVHGRTRAQMYAPPVDLSIIKEVKDSVSIPVIGNGDIYSAMDAVNMLETTGCDAVMVGRGALGSPWIFMQINAWLNDCRVIDTPPLMERMRVMNNHIAKLCEYKGERVGMKEARKHTAWYMTGLAGAASLRKMCGTLEKLSDMAALTEAVLVKDAEKRKIES